MFRHKYSILHINQCEHFSNNQVSAMHGGIFAHFGSQTNKIKLIRPRGAQGSQLSRFHPGLFSENLVKLYPGAHPLPHPQDWRHLVRRILDPPLM